VYRGVELNVDERAAAYLQGCCLGCSLESEDLMYLALDSLKVSLAMLAE